MFLHVLLPSKEEELIILSGARKKEDEERRKRAVRMSCHGNDTNRYPKPTIKTLLKLCMSIGYKMLLLF